VAGNHQAPTVTKEIESETVNRSARKLPPGYSIETGGTVEESAKAGGIDHGGDAGDAAAVMTLLMIQLKSFRRTLLVLLFPHRWVLSAWCLRCWCFSCRSALFATLGLHCPGWHDHAQLSHPR